MEVGARRLATAIMAGGLSAMVVSGCGSSDSPTEQKWTSTVPTSIPTTRDTAGDETLFEEEAVSGSVATTTVANTVTTAAVGTTVASDPVSPSTTAGPPAVSTESELPTADGKPLEEPNAEASVTTTQETEERVITHTDAVVANDYWDDLGLPDPAAPPVEDPERILYAEEQIQKVYFRWYDGIYRKDPETLEGAVTDRSSYERGVAVMERMEFTAPPTLEGVEVRVLELYVDHPDCLVAAYEMDISSFRQSDLIERITILWPHSQYGWRRHFSFGWPTIYGDWWANCFIKDRLQFP
ncbi:MAG: hypothetical protein OXD34_06200 [bacterium]|nr:hypothetical protein [Acidimicrobiia bacterium]MCY4621414.1 hypothetical protein [bacterium]